MEYRGAEPAGAEVSAGMSTEAVLIACTFAEPVGVPAIGA